MREGAGEGMLATGEGHKMKAHEKHNMGETGQDDA